MAIAPKQILPKVVAMSSKEDGSEQVKFTAFYEALLEARACLSPLVDPVLAKAVASFPIKLWFRAMAIC